MTESYDVVVVGAGVAGLTAALTAAGEGAHVLVVTKGQVRASASYEAQGGIAAAVGANDSPAQHAEDTLGAGRGLCRASAVRILTEEAPERVEDLRRLGVGFDKTPGLEGGHSQRRVLRVEGAQTGRALIKVLRQHALDSPLIEIREYERVLALDPGLGCVTKQRVVYAPSIVLATGGYAALWSRTTNRRSSIGDGIALAYRAGAAVADLEFVQFHPTTLATGRLLLSEALRGAGARLIDSNGDQFVDELAPRDVVARAVAERTTLLDLAPIEHSEFPGLIERLKSRRVDPSLPVPVSPAAHYTIGGVVTDLDGRTTVPGLFAAGECACTGVHGANRLASNSLLECLVFGRRAALAALDAPSASASHATYLVEPERLTERVREQMWHDAGLVRDETGLTRLRRSRFLLARLTAQAALARRESRGSHFRSDLPYKDPTLDGHHTLLRLGSAAPVLQPWN